MGDSLDGTLKSVDADADVRGMGTVLPDNPAAQLQFFQTRAEGWAVDPPAIGLSDAQAAVVVDATARAAAALAAAQLARQAAKNATTEWEQAARALRELGGSAITAIKAHARITGDPSVYAAASIEAPNRPGPKHRTPDEADAALPRVRSCTARPNAFGGVEVEWTCGHGATMGAGAGMFYRVRRSIDRGEFALLEVVGSPGAGRRTVRFTDKTVPTGTRLVEYSVTPLRGTATGRPSSAAAVYFGSGQSTASPAQFSGRRAA